VIAPTPEACRKAGEAAAVGLRALAADVRVGPPFLTKLRAEAVRLVGIVIALIERTPAAIWRAWMAAQIRKLDAGIRTHSSGETKRTGWIYTEIPADEIEGMAVTWETWAAEIGSDLGGGDGLPEELPVGSVAPRPGEVAAVAWFERAAFALGLEVVPEVVRATWGIRVRNERMGTTWGETGALHSVSIDGIGIALPLIERLRAAGLDLGPAYAGARGTDHKTEAKTTPNPEGPPIFPLVVRRQSGTGGPLEEEGGADAKYAHNAHAMAARLSLDGSICTVSEQRSEGEKEIGRYLGGEEVEIPAGGSGGGDGLASQDAGAVPSVAVDRIPPWESIADFIRREQPGARGLAGLTLMGLVSEREGQIREALYFVLAQPDSSRAREILEALVEKLGGGS
jgi:hypothetical protein